MAHKITNGTLTITFDDLSSSEAACLIAEVMQAASEAKTDSNFTTNFILHSQSEKSANNAKAEKVQK